MAGIVSSLGGSAMAIKPKYVRSFSTKSELRKRFTSKSGIVFIPTARIRLPEDERS